MLLIVTVSVFRSKIKAMGALVCPTRISLIYFLLAVLVIHYLVVALDRQNIIGKGVWHNFISNRVVSNILY